MTLGSTILSQKVKKKQKLKEKIFYNQKFILEKKGWLDLKIYLTINRVVKLNFQRLLPGNDAKNLLGQDFERISGLTYSII